MGPEEVLVIGHGAVEAFLPLTGGILDEVGLAVGAVDGGEHFEVFVAEGDEVTGFLGDHGFDDAVVEGVGFFVFGDGDGIGGMHCLRDCGHEQKGGNIETFHVSLLENTP